MRGLAPRLIGQTITHVTVRRRVLRFPLPECFAERLQGGTIERLGRRAKYLLVFLAAQLPSRRQETEDCLILHLGMSGTLRFAPTNNGPYDAHPLAKEMFVHPRTHLGAHDHVSFHLSGGQTLIFNDPRRFGMMDVCPAHNLDGHPWLHKLGVEPMDKTFSAACLAAQFKDTTTNLKAALLDQRRIAGLGNIYVSEALHQAGLLPSRKAGTLVLNTGEPSAALKRLAKAISQVLQRAIDAGGSTLRDHHQVNGALGYFQHQFQVYNREGKPCLRVGCTGTITRAVQNGRASFFCAQCQM